MEEIDSKIGMEQSILPWLGRTAKMMFIYVRQEMEQANIDLTLKQLIVLRHLVEQDFIDQKQLALVTERDKTSLTRLISTMEKKELLTREKPDHDRRVNYLRITPKGRQAHASAMPILKMSTGKLLKGIAPEELDNARETIKKINQNIKNLTYANT